MLSDTFMVRILPPHHANLGKRVIKSPKAYLRDSGLLHALLGIGSLGDLLAHPSIGASWEGFVIEHVVAHAREGARTSFCRTSSGAQRDLLLKRGNHRDAWEVRFGLAPRATHGYNEALRDLGLASGRVVYSGDETFPLGANALATGLGMAFLDVAK